jgi:hypothetical protein
VFGWERVLSEVDSVFVEVPSDGAAATTTWDTMRQRREGGRGFDANGAGAGESWGGGRASASASGRLGGRNVRARGAHDASKVKLARRVLGRSGAQRLRLRLRLRLRQVGAIEGASQEQKRNAGRSVGRSVAQAFREPSSHQCPACLSVQPSPVVVCCCPVWCGW